MVIVTLPLVAVSTVRTIINYFFTLQMKPPSPSDNSYEQFSKELDHIHCVLTERTKTAFETFNSIPGYFCNELEVSLQQ